MYQRNWIKHLGVWSALVASGGLASSLGYPAQAQLVFDGTLGNVTAGQAAGGVIDSNQGLSRNNNLFHSFQQFEVRTDITFQPDVNTQNIISRVTGGSGSLIDAMITAPGVNFFLIDPRGITFGDGANLNIGRSFVATTADSLVFDDNTAFSAVNTDAAPLLTINNNALPAQLIFGTNPGAITVNNDGFSGPAPPFLTAQGLDVNAGETLALLGGNILLNGGILQAPDGQIELGGLSGAGTIELNVENNVIGVNGFLEGAPRADVQITGQSVIDVTTNNASGGGSVSIQAGNIDVAGDSSICAGLGSSVICGGNPMMMANPATRPARNVTLDATGQVQIRDGSRVENDVNPGATGNAGNVLIRAGSIVLANDAIVSSSSFGTGEAGNILLDAPSIQIDNSIVSSELFGTGTGANQFAGNLINILLGGSSELFGSVLIFTDFLELSNDAQLRSNTFGNGNAGAVFVRGGDVEIRNGGAVLSGVADVADGTAGGIVMFVDNLRIQGDNTGLTTSTFSPLSPGQNGAGLILISATGDVLVDGNGSGIFSTVGTGIDQVGGAIGITASRLAVANGARIGVDNQGTNQAGIIDITADLIALVNQAEISATTASGNGGDIEVESIFVALDSSSNITTNAEAAGMGGNIFLTVQSEIISFSLADSNVVANAVSGAAGRVVLGGVPALRGIAVRDADTAPLNDITASSDFGVDGTVTGDVFEQEQVRATQNLPEQLIDPSSLIAQGCALGDLQAAQNIGEFTVTGRGGLAPDPSQQLGQWTISTGLATLDPAGTEAETEPGTIAPEDASGQLDSMTLEQEDSELGALPLSPNRASTNRSGTIMVNRLHSDKQAPVVEAKGWRYGADGEIILTAQANNTAAPPLSAFSGVTCNDF